MTPEEESLETLTGTSLWQRTLGKDDPHVKPLRESFLRSRENAMPLLAKIREDFPNLTVHDITHVDSLWRVADTIIGPDYLINPLEGYILGMAFMIHDAAHSYESVGGKEALRSTTEWRDFHSDEHNGMDEEEFKKACDFATIRALHAKKAGEILTKTFTRDNGTAFYLIDNDSYRNHYGKLIGLIAASHHWEIEELDTLKNSKTPLSGMPNEWKINPQKLACILRCADAGHIDNGRAPDNIFFDRSLAINGVSREHWAAQNPLGQLCEDDDERKLLITSLNPFPKEEFAAWNVAYEAVVQLDREIRKSNELLRQLSKKENLVFPHVGVLGAESREALSEYIETDGWTPCDMNVHTSNVKALIENLGGSKLYGEKNMLLVALRELIQNARDAIHARRTMDPQHFGIDDGKITIRRIQKDGKIIIEVEDNGIGMSRDCIKNHLLDFGSSYWKSALALVENPGLRSKRFTSVGKFGIGFYSIFMVAKSVAVITRRFKKEATREWDNKEIETIKVEFPDGLTLSPILSNDKLSTSVSTVVRFELKEDVETTFNFHESEGFIDLPKALSILVAGLNVDVFFDEDWNLTQVHTNIESSDFNINEWFDSILIHHFECFDDLASHFERITDNNGIQRGLLIPPEHFTIIDNFINKFQILPPIVPFITSIGGLMSESDLDKVCRIYEQNSYSYYSLNNKNIGLIGYFDGVEGSMNRNTMVFDDSTKKGLHEWAKRKVLENIPMTYSNSHSSLLSERYNSLLRFCYTDGEKMLNERQIYKIYRNNRNDFHWTWYDIFRVTHPGGELNYNQRYSIFNRQVKWTNKKSILNFLNTQFDRQLEYYTDTYCILALFKAFSSVDIPIIPLCIWVNLILDMRCQVMIDWRKASMERRVYRDWSYKRTIDYLKQFLSSTYLEEITESTDGDDE